MWLNVWQLGRAVESLRGGGILAYATEAVFGLGCDPEDEDALWRLLALKRRPAHKGLILIAADPVQLEPYIQPLTAAMAERILPTWPGPHTWIVPARPGLSSLVRGAHASVAVRVTAHPQVQALCRRYGGAVVSTSANRTGQPPARSAFQVRQRLGAEVDFILPGRVGSEARPSCIRDARTGAVLRPA